MPRYLDNFTDSVTSLWSTIGYGLRARLKEGYSGGDLRADVMAGLVVGVVALPLSMALAIASGVAPQYGLYTAIVAGVTCSLLGGTRCQVTGPTAAFVVILAPIVGKFGLGGLLVAGMLAGLMLVGMAAAKLGRLITFIPHPVTTGFTAGIAVVIGTIQLKDFLGLSFDHAPEGYVDRWKAMWHARASASGWEIAVGALTLALLVGLPRVIKKIPAPLLALAIAGIAATLATKFIPGFHVATIGSRFHSTVNGHEVAGIPPLPPLPLLPWHMPGAGGGVMHLDWATIQALFPAAFAIAMLGAIESLLAAVVSDGMSGSKHEPNAELFALGIGNILCPFFGGIAATGALARTATNIRAGARSPLAACVHAVFVLACTVALAPLVAYLPMAALAGLLLLVAKNMAEARHFVHIVKVAPRSDMLVLLVCFGLTVVFDMVLAVSVGVVLAALLFMRRMSELAESKLDTGTMAKFDVPPGVRLYEIAGPLFFGAAQKAMSVFDQIQDRSLAVIVYMAQVPVMDATGLVALETVIDRLKRGGHKVILAGLKPQPAEMLERAGIRREPGKLAIAPDLDTALSLAIVHRARQPEPPAGPQATATA
ncbi:MAG TPA: C4-dicarboxylic acid transporter DauA [Polyangia bacterium]|nr:C4-dicarboxylic acid transporter DauA [Polyangia bacterium]